ncbi:MAG: carcinine hydrolase/isopenicillin-N N-acyltransferase family protein [Polyangiaceae bacterium]
MCTIGAVFADGGVHLFKQCDLASTTQFQAPAVRVGALRYIAMTRSGRPGLWAGMNEAGVSFVAADAYTNRTYEVEDADVDALFNAYEKAVATCKSAGEAADQLQAFYRSYCGGQGFPGPDIAMHADPTQAIFTEYTPGPNLRGSVREVVVRGGFLASTNHFRVQPDAVVYQANHSTYLRLDRAETILERAPSLAGVVQVLSDQYYGPSELSICRVAEYPGEHFTQATAIFTAGAAGLGLLYQINGDPITNPLQPFEGVKSLRVGDALPRLRRSRRLPACTWRPLCRTAAPRDARARGARDVTPPDEP